jgi:hypothetical protein
MVVFQNESFNDYFFLFYLPLVVNTHRMANDLMRDEKELRKEIGK